MGENNSCPDLENTIQNTDYIDKYNFCQDLENIIQQKDIEKYSFCQDLNKFRMLDKIQNIY